MSDNTENKENATEVKTEQTGSSKPWMNRIVSVVVGILVGIASMFGINQTQINTFKTEIEKAYTNLKTANDAIKAKDYPKAAEAVLNATTAIKTIIGEGKEAAETVKETAAEYKESVLALKTAIDEKNYEKVTEIAGGLLTKITERIPADQLTGKTKEVYDIVKQISDDLNNKRYEPVVNLVTKLVNLFSKD